MRKRAGGDDVIDLPDATPAAPRTEPSGAVDLQDAFAALYPSLRRFAAMLCDADQDPDDLLQEALTRFIERASVGETGDLNAYLRRTMCNLRANHRRSVVRWRRRAPLLVADDALLQAYPSDLAVLDVLSPVERVVLYLVHVEREPYAAVGALLGRPESSVRQIASRARARLRSEMEASHGS